jgi:tetratricopeptide (TPR) repeat protein
MARLRGSNRVLVVAGALAIAGSLVAPATPADATAGACITDGPYATSGATAEVCLEAPGDGSVVSGTVDVSATLDNVGTPTSPLSAFGARRMIFTLDGQPLLTDYDAPFTFRLPTERFVDGAHTLEVRALLRDSFTDEPNHETPLLTITLLFDNGIGEVPPNTNTFEPTTGHPPAAGAPFVVAATGDGASGELEADAVSDLVLGWDPNLFLYLGDVYEDGTPTEFLNWYGTADTRWGRLRDITNPTVGNHEYDNGVAAGYFDYWDNVPHYYGFDTQGWHFATIDSNSVFGQTDPGTSQYEWLRQDLAGSASRCSVVYVHHPFWSIGSQGSTERLTAIWKLLVGSGADIVLTGHDHNYQRWQPLDADGAPHPAGPTHFVVGSGGHGIRPFVQSDPRVVAGLDTFANPDSRGALRLSLGPDSADFEYVTADGVVRDSGTIACHAPQFTPGSVRNRISLERVALDALVPSGNGSLDDKVGKAIEHLDESLADKRWSSDDRPADRDGHKVVDGLKNAVHDLEDAPLDASVQAAIVRLSSIGQELVDAAIEEAQLAYGAVDELMKAGEERESGLSKLAEGKHEEALDKFKKSFEQARKALDQAPDPWQPDVGRRGQIGDVLAAVWPLVPSGDGGDDGELADALDELGAALDLTLWDDDDRPSDSSDAKVPDRLKRAVEKLEKVDRTDVTAQMLEALTASEDLAHDAIAEAVARGGDPDKIAEAEAKIAEGHDKLADGKYRDAADAYKKAFEKARSA